MLKRIIPLGVVAVFFAIAWNYQAIADWWFLRSYTPSAEVAALANDSYMSDHGERLFYLSDPKINDKEEFNENCPIIEESFVLGCYAAGRIYILSVEREELDGIMEVTAAHEMLHKAYDRLDEEERSDIVDELESFYATLDDSVINDLIASYEERGGVAIRQNELHSIIPTQIVDLPPQLEEYYDQYFTDRVAVAELYESYETVFVEINQRIGFIKAQVDSIRGEIRALEQQMVSASDRVESLNSELERLEGEDEIDAYNELVPQQNDAVAQYNQLLDTYRARISAHNRLVDEVNEIVLYQEDLVNSMDSTFQSM